MYDLPKVYHAVVSRAALDRVYNKSGSYFPGPSPDMANAIGLCCTLKNHVYLEFPIIISGFSYKSTGGMGARGAHIGDIKSMKHLPKDTDKLWEKKVPKLWTGETIYAESTIKSLRAMGEDEALKKFNYLNMYAAFISYNTGFNKMIFPFVKNIKDVLMLTYYVAKIFLRRGRNYILNKLESKFGISQKKLYDNVDSLSQALEIVDEYNESLDLSSILKKYKKI